MAKQGCRGEIIYWAILIATSNRGGGVAINEVLNAKSSFDQFKFTIPEYTNEYLVKAKQQSIAKGST